jgi:hypothetical protein
MQGALIAAMTQVYPRDTYDNPKSWLRVRRLGPHARLAQQFF